MSMTHDEANAKHWEPIFADAIHKVAPQNSQIYSKLIMGLQAERDLAVRQCEDLSAELATLKQRKMATEKMSLMEELCFKCGLIALPFAIIVLIAWVYGSRA